MSTATKATAWSQPRNIGLPRAVAEGSGWSFLTSATGGTSVMVRGARGPRPGSDRDTPVPNAPSRPDPSVSTSGSVG